MLKKNIPIFFALCSILFCSSLLFAAGDNIVLATGTVSGTDSPAGISDSENLESTKPIKLINPLGDETKSIPILIGNVISAALGIVGSLALIMFIYGGFTWMLAAGNEQAVTKGKNVLIWATVGLTVIFASYSLVNFIIKTAIKGGA
jgi:hypothetical protein